MRCWNESREPLRILIVKLEWSSLVGGNKKKALTLHRWGRNRLGSATCVSWWRWGWGGARSRPPSWRPWRLACWPGPARRPGAAPRGPRSCAAPAASPSASPGPSSPRPVWRTESPTEKNDAFQLRFFIFSKPPPHTTIDLLFLYVKLLISLSSSSWLVFLVFLFCSSTACRWC